MDNEAKYQKMYAKIIAWFYLSLMIFTVAKRLIPLKSISTVISLIIAFTPLIILIIKLIILKKLTVRYRYITLVFVFITILYLISYLNKVPLSKVLFYYFFSLIGLFIMDITFSIKNLDLLYDEFTKKSFFIMLISILIIFTDRTSNPYNMRFSYILLISLCFHTLEFLKYNKKINFIYALIEFILIFIYGSRGPVLCFIIFLIIYILFENKKILLKGTLISAIVIAYFNLRKVMLLVANIFEKAHISSRTLYLLVNDFGHTAGRDIIAIETIKLIKEHPIFGLGIAGEFKYMEDYPHNIFLDLLVNWGVIIGTLLFITLLILIFKSLLKAKNKEKLLILIFISYGYVALFFSGTYLSWDGLYILMGCCFRVIISKKKGYKHEVE